MRHFFAYLRGLEKFISFDCQWKIQTEVNEPETQMKINELYSGRWWKRKTQKGIIFLFYCLLDADRELKARKLFWKQLRKAYKQTPKVEGKTIKGSQRTKICPMRGHNKPSTVSLRIQPPLIRSRYYVRKRKRMRGGCIRRLLDS